MTKLTDDQVAALVRRYIDGEYMGLAQFVREVERTIGAASTTNPSDYVLMPRRLTADNGAKGLLSGEFKESIEVYCTECDGQGQIDGEDCEVCEGDGDTTRDVTVGWDTIKEIYAMAVDNLACIPAKGCGE